MDKNDYSRLPRLLTRRLEHAFEEMDKFRKLQHIPSMMPRYREAVLVFNAAKAEVDAALEVTVARDESRKLDRELREEVEAHNKTIPKKRMYSDEDLDRVASSSLAAGKGSKDHLALAIEISMNFGSLMWFLKMRDFLSGDGHWVQCSPAFMGVVARGDTALLEEMRERNRMGYEAWLLARKEALENKENA